MRGRIQLSFPILAAVTALLFTTDSASAVTVTVTAGVPGIHDSLDVIGYMGEPIAFKAAVGGYNAQTREFIQFGEQFIEFGSILGWKTTAFGPASVNNSEVFLAIAPATGPLTGDILSSGVFVILGQNPHPLFPSDVTAPGAVTFNAFVPSQLTMIAQGSMEFGFDGDNVGFGIPEPGSTGLLLVGAAMASGWRRRSRAT